MKAQKESILYGIIGLLLGGILVGATATVAVNSNNSGMMRMMGMRVQTTPDTGMMGMDHDSGSDHMGMSMESMTTALKGKSGDAFDKAFIAEMIDHHQGAIDMANLAKNSAKHAEIKQMADDIVTAQTKEINQMKQWQSEWSY